MPKVIFACNAKNNEVIKNILESIWEIINFCERVLYCYDKVPPTEWLRSTEVYPLIVLSPEVWLRGLGGAMLPAKPLGENLSSPLPVTWFMAAYLCSSAVLWASPLWYLCVYCPHLIWTLCLDVGPTLNPGWFCLESLNFLQRPYFLVHFPSDVNFGEHYSYVIYSQSKVMVSSDIFW